MRSARLTRSQRSRRPVARTAAQASSAQVRPAPAAARKFRPVRKRVARSRDPDPHLAGGPSGPLHEDRPRSRSHPSPPPGRSNRCGRSACTAHSGRARGSRALAQASGTQDGLSARAAGCSYRSCGLHGAARPGSSRAFASACTQGALQALSTRCHSGRDRMARPGRLPHPPAPDSPDHGRTPALCRGAACSRGHLVRARGSPHPHPSARGLPRPGRPIVVYPFLGALGWIGIQLAPSRRGQAKSFLGKPVVAEAVVQTYYGPEVTLTRRRTPPFTASCVPRSSRRSHGDRGHTRPQRRGAPHSFLQPPKVVFLAVEILGPRFISLASSTRPSSRCCLRQRWSRRRGGGFYGPDVTLAPSRRPLTQSVLQPPAVVFTAVELSGPEVTLTRITPPAVRSLPASAHGGGSRSRGAVRAGHPSHLLPPGPSCLRPAAPDCRLPVLRTADRHHSRPAAPGCSQVSPHAAHGGAPGRRDLRPRGHAHSFAQAGHQVPSRATHRGGPGRFLRACPVAHVLS